MSRLTEFYRGSGKDAEGRTLAQIWDFSDQEMEEYHDFIQWLFPLRQPSAYNAHAPLVTDVDIAEFRNEPALSANLLRSFDRFLRFVGLEQVDGRVQRGQDFALQQQVWLEPNHNWLRVTRVLHSFRLLGRERESQAFFECLKDLNAQGEAQITSNTMKYWQNAAPGR